MTAGKVFAGLTEKYMNPVPVAMPSETVISTPTRPEVISPALKVILPSGRVKTCALSVYCTTAETKVRGSPSGSTKLPSALAT